MLQMGTWYFPAYSPGEKVKIKAWDKSGTIWAIKISKYNKFEYLFVCDRTSLSWWFSADELEKLEDEKERTPET